MRAVLRKLRGIIGTGVAGSAAWTAFSSAVLALGGNWGQILAGLLPNALFGFTLGATFAVVLSVAEQRSRFDELSLGGVAFCGWLAGVIVAGGSMLFRGLGAWELLVAYPLPAAGLAAGIFALARRGRDIDLVEGAEEPLLIPKED
jgi:hypothetical protein